SRDARERQVAAMRPASVKRRVPLPPAEPADRGPSAAPGLPPAADHRNNRPSTAAPPGDPPAARGAPPMPAPSSGANAANPREAPRTTPPVRRSIISPPPTRRGRLSAGVDR